MRCATVWGGGGTSHPFLRVARADHLLRTGERSLVTRGARPVAYRPGAPRVVRCGRPTAPNPGAARPFARSEDGAVLASGSARRLVLLPARRGFLIARSELCYCAKRPREAEVAGTGSGRKTGSDRDLRRPFFISRGEILRILSAAGVVSRLFLTFLIPRFLGRGHEICEYWSLGAVFGFAIRSSGLRAKRLNVGLVKM